MVAFGWQTGISVFGSAAAFPLFLLLLYQATLRPRLFIYNCVIVHFMLWSALAAIIGLFWWIFIVASGREAINQATDVMLITGGMLFSWVVIAWRLPLLWQALTPTRAPEEQIKMRLSYLGKLDDKVGRASYFPDTYLDATFSLDIVKKSPRLKKTITQLLMNRMNARGMPTRQEWIANGARIMWPLAVFDDTGHQLNPVGALGEFEAGDLLSLTIYASDWEEKGSDWFRVGQRYRVTVYFSDNTWIESQVIIN